MTDPKGNSEFCFHETLNSANWPQMSVEGKQNTLFPADPVIKCFVILPKTKIEKKHSWLAGS